MSDAAELRVTISGTDVNLKRLLTELRRELVQADQQATRTGRAIGDDLAAGATKGQAGVLRMQAALARNAAAAGDTERAIQRLKTALGGITVSTSQTIAMEGQLARLERTAAQTATTLPQTTSALGGLAAAAGPVALSFATTQLVAYGREAITLANTTRDASRALEILAGSPQRYAEALAVATQQQKLFGGSLAENIGGIQGLITVSRSSGVELARLVDLAQRLSVKDPSQGIAGARLALNEALAGDPTSLARRYEIPKAALAALRDESTTAQQKLAILDSYLTQIGITSESVAGSISKETQAFNSLGAATEALQIKVGTLLSQALTPAAQGATALFTSLATGEQANATLTALALTMGDVAGKAMTANPAVAGMQMAMQQLGPAVGLTQQATTQWVSGLLSLAGVLTPAQQQLQAYQQAHAQTAQAIQAVASTYQLLSANVPAAAAGLQSMVPALQAVAAESDANAATVRALMDGLLNETITVAQVRAALTDLEQAHAITAAAAAEQANQELLLTDQHIGLSEAVLQVAESLNQEATQKAHASEQAAILNDINARVADLGAAVAQGLIGAGQAAGFLSQQYGIATNAAYALVAAQAALATGDARLRAQAAQTRNLAPDGIGYNAPGRRGAGDSAVDAVVALQREAAAARETARTVAQAEASKTAARAGSARASGGSGGSGGSGRSASTATPRLTAEQRAAQQLVTLDETTAQKRETLERDHQETMAAIATEGAKKRQQALERYSLESKHDRASFYRQLGQMDDPAMRAKLSAQYEAIQREAAHMAESQGADVADAYRDAAIKAAQGQAEIQQEIAKARADGDLGKAEYLEGVAKLQADADQAELASIQAHGSALAAETAKRYADEEAAYAKHLDAMVQTYQEKVGKLGMPPAGSVAPPPGQPASSAPAPPSAPRETRPAPVQDASTTQAVVSSQQALTDRLTSLKEVMEGVRRAVEQVEGAVRSLKSSTSFKS